MRKTAIKMLILGVAVVTLCGAASVIKDSYAASGASEAELVQMNAEAKAWLERVSAALEKAGVPHSEGGSNEAAEEDATDKNAAALGESVSVPMNKSASALPWVVVILGLAGGAAIVFVAVNKQYQLVTEESAVSRAVNEIVAKSNALRTGAGRQAGTGRWTGAGRKSQKKQKDDEFDEITRAVDEIVAKYQKDS